MKSRDTPGVYDVGFCKPPEATRFKPGQSGNPKGRPRGTLNLATAVQKALRERVIVTENGRRRSVSKLDATVTQLVNRAVKGDARATQQLLGLAPMMAASAASFPGLGDSETERAVLADAVKRLTMLEPGVEPVDDPSGDPK